MKTMIFRRVYRITPPMAHTLAKSELQRTSGVDFTFSQTRLDEIDVFRVGFACFYLIQRSLDRYSI